jgi:hypothetical protein
MRTSFLALVLITLGVLVQAIHRPAFAEDPMPLTRPERTSNAETSTAAEVEEFLAALAARGAPLRVQPLGVSTLGRPIPLVICARPMVADGAAACASGRIVVYVQANIHGGEVEGKEAALMLLREIAAGERDRWLERCVLVIAPNYNPDGNEAWGDGLANRPHQNGPARIGERANGAGLDLNRDCTKAESPEMRAALAGVYLRFDPHVVIDLHTTNGTRHGYTLTYATSLHPDTDAGLLDFARGTLLAGARDRMFGEHGERLNDYGNVEGEGEARAWRTFSPLGRYVTNYVGLRNRIAVLSEATSYLPLGTRIETTRRFVAATIDIAAERHEEIARLCREADRRAEQGEVGPLALAMELESRGRERVPLESPAERRAAHEAPGAIVEEELEIFDRFRATATRPLPRAWWIPAAEGATIALLRRHGIEVEPCRADAPLTAEEFRIASATRAERPNQGHRALRLTGEWRPAEIPAAAARGGYLVPARQPLARLAFHLLEPDLEDGAVAWEVIAAPLAEGGVAPVRRLR